MEKIYIYAPVDGEIDLIENLHDGVFSEKMLGDGFFITPHKNKFYSPLADGEVSLITESKHAFFFKKDKVNILMHIGLDTVNLNGKPFDVKIKLKQKISLKTEIVDVDLDMIKDANLNNACPITIDSQQKKYKFNLLTKNKKVKQGELIGEFELIERIIENKENFKDFFSNENTYRKIAKKINNLVGGQSNYNQVYNCMTRLRFQIKDVNKVEVDKIKKIDLVKGIIWNGKELQVIIGQDVYKVKDQVELINSESGNEFTLSANVALPWYKKFMQMFMGIMAPTIPIFIGFGLFQAILGILSYESIGIVPPEVLTGQLTPETSIGWVILYALAKTSTMFLGIVIAYNAGNYFNLNKPISVALGLVLCSPLLFGTGGPMMQGNQWILWQGNTLETGILVIDGDPSMGIPPINSYVIAPQNLKIFVIIAAVYLAKKIDNWVISWIPAQIELTFRWFIVLGLTVFPTFFIFGPIWFYCEKILGILFYYLSKVPLGIGIGVVAAIWQPAVIFGAHGAIGMLFITDAYSNYGFGHFGMVSHISVWAQFGAILGVALITKNAATRKESINLAIPGIFGITEPILYGMNLPKKRPLLAGVISAFIAGSLAGALQITTRVQSGLGIFELIGYFSDTTGLSGTTGPELGFLSGLENGLYLLLCDALAIGLGIGLTMLLYKERLSEKKQLIKNDKLFVKYLLLKKYINEQQAQQLLNNLVSISSMITKEDEIKIKEIEKKYQKILKIETKISNYKSKMITYKDKFILKGKNLLQKNKENEAKKLYEKYNSQLYDKKIKDLEDILSKLKENFDNNFIFEFYDNFYKKYNEILNNIKKLNDLEKDSIDRKYKGILNSLRILYRLDEFDEGEINFSKEINKLNKENKLSLKAKKI